MLEIKIPVEIQYKDPETGEHITVIKKVINSIDEWDKQLSVKFYCWDNDCPQVSWIKIMGL